MKTDQEFKADAGKTRPSLIEEGFAKALRVVQATTDYGAEKYEAHSWRKVPQAKERYKEAAKRHKQERDIAGGNVLSCDPESGIPHIAHEIFCLLAQLELALSDLPRTVEGEVWRQYVNYKKPPMEHKSTFRDASVRDIYTAQTLDARETDARGLER